VIARFPERLCYRSAGDLSGASVTCIRQPRARKDAAQIPALPYGVEMFDPTVQISLLRKSKLANRVTLPVITKVRCRLSSAAIRRLRARALS
jgi:hypothetical protein